MRLARWSWPDEVPFSPLRYEPCSEPLATRRPWHRARVSQGGSVPPGVRHLAHVRRGRSAHDTGSSASSLRGSRRGLLRRAQRAPDARYKATLEGRQDCLIALRSDFPDLDLSLAECAAGARPDDVIDALCLCMDCSTVVGPQVSPARWRGGNPGPVNGDSRMSAQPGGGLQSAWSTRAGASVRQSP